MSTDLARGQYSECIQCFSRQCERAEVGKLDVCDAGIVFYVSEKQIRKHREIVTTRDIAGNLRHELHRVLAYIVAQAEELDPGLSTKTIDLARPASRIVGATVILDKFIEMVSGVFEFHPDRSTHAWSGRNRISLRDTVDRLLNTYSLIKNNRRASHLKIKLDIPPGIHVAVLPSVIENLIAIFADNTWKYSQPGSSVHIQAVVNAAGFADLHFTTIGPRVDDSESLFRKGYQGQVGSEGFGFGLYWATVLVAHYNEVVPRPVHSMELVHTQVERDVSLAKHTFSVTNMAVNVDVRPGGE